MLLDISESHQSSSVTKVLCHNYLGNLYKEKRRRFLARPSIGFSAFEGVETSSLSALDFIGVGDWLLTRILRCLLNVLSAFIVGGSQAFDKSGRVSLHTRYLPS